MNTVKRLISLNIMILISHFAFADVQNLDAVATADSLYAGLKSGDSALVQAVLDPQVLIFESGGVESSLQEYASHHMHADMKFLSGIERKVLFRQVIEESDIAIISTRASMTGTYGTTEIDIISTETLVLQDKGQGWRITHIHWSTN